MTVVRAKRCVAIDDRTLRRIVRAALAHAGVVRARLNLVLMGDEALAELHARFLGDPSPTDVIAFELSDENGLEGEVCCSLDCARRLARERGVTFERELALYVVHGVLHLCGYDDTTPRARAHMRSAERNVLQELGYADDPNPHP